MTEAAAPTAPGSATAPTAAPAPPARSSNLVGAGILAVWLALGAFLLAAPRPPHVLTFAFVMVGWLLSVMVHEFSHAFIAWKAGDHTVKAKGYLDFDPRRYGALQTTLVVPILALALGGIGFPGGAVYLRDDLMRGRAWRAAAALAGPAATLAILVLLAGALRLWANFGARGDLFPALGLLAFLQAMALILNLLPIPGFDGFNAIRPFLPRALAAAIRKAQALAPLVLLALVFFTPAGGRLFAAAAALTTALGVPPQALQYGWNAFHFWR
ncbi:MAG TPA: site-2 protease family protein [Caulobacteraceae bacterium]|nr:site-2 protease family protein [Caulobacteraceae bacterium]